MRHHRTCAAVLVVLMLATGAAADPTAARLDELVQKYVALEQFNGSVLAARDGKVVLARGYGSANLEWSIPNAPDTRFRIGSITKQFTATMILQLVEEGRLALDTTLAEALPGYREDTGSRVTIHHLLNHTSGIPSYTSDPSFRERRRMPLTTGRLVQELCSGDLEFEPGSQYRYSNSGYVLLGAILERLTGTSYAEALQERILAPAGMSATGYDSSATILPKRAAGYVRRPDGIANADYIDMSLPFAAGAMYSTVEDLFRWDRALVAGRVLPTAVQETMYTPGLSNYGYGWGIRTVPIGPGGEPRRRISHAGGIDGFSSMIVRVPEDGVAVVVLDNASDHSATALAEGLLEVLYGRTPAEPKRPIAAVLMDLLHEQGAAAAVARYRALKASGAADVDWSEAAVNELGYLLLAQERVDDALAIFTLNAEEYPDSWNVHDSLGEALAAKGEKELAIRSYARSLELNPANTGAVQQLSRLVAR